jgi:hypothetical protein
MILPTSLMMNKDGKPLVQLPHSAKASQAIAERIEFNWRGSKPS